jgi:hypothetical protein
MQFTENLFATIHFRISSTHMLPKQTKIRRRVILPAVLYTCKIWVFTLTLHRQLERPLKCLSGLSEEKNTVPQQAPKFKCPTCSRNLAFKGSICWWLRGKKLIKDVKDKVCRKLYGPRSGEVTGERKKFHNEEHHTYWTETVTGMGETTNTYRVLVGKF